MSDEPKKWVAYKCHYVGSQCFWIPLGAYNDSLMARIRCQLEARDSGLEWWEAADTKRLVTPDGRFMVDERIVGDTTAVRLNQPKESK